MAFRWSGALVSRSRRSPRGDHPPSPGHRAALAFLPLLAAACGAPPPPDLGPTEDGGLRACDPAPGCVHTAQGHPPEYPGFLLAPAARERDPADVRRELARALESLPDTELVARDGPYLRAEARSRVLRRVDDLELYWEPGDEEVAVRSEARTRRAEFGRNLRRVESLRQTLEEGDLLE